MERDDLDGYECRKCGKAPSDASELQSGVCRDCRSTRTEGADLPPDLKHVNVPTPSTDLAKLQAEGRALRVEQGTSEIARIIEDHSVKNDITIRLVKIIELDPDTGDELGGPTFGVIAADDYASDYNDTYKTFGALKAAIEASGGDPLALLDPLLFGEDRTG